MTPTFYSFSVPESSSSSIGAIVGGVVGGIAALVLAVVVVVLVYLFCCRDKSEGEFSLSSSFCSVQHEALFLFLNWYLRHFFCDYGLKVSYVLDLSPESGVKASDKRELR